MDNAKKHKKDLGDEFLSVEHFMLALCSDKRFGEQLFKNLQLSEKELKDAVLAVRGNQRVTDQSMFLCCLICNIVIDLFYSTMTYPCNLIVYVHWLFLEVICLKHFFLPRKKA